MAEKTLKKVDENALTTGLSQQDYELAKATVAKGASDAEFKLLAHVANKYQLDPLLKEIWCIKRSANDPAVIMTSRDGYLSIAHRSGQLDGLQSGYTLNDKGGLESAWCEIWRKDMSHSFKAQVRFIEYNNPNSPTWKKFPSAMLIKVAETFALKRAFSISGMTTQEEIGIEEPETITETPKLQEPREANMTEDQELTIGEWLDELTDGNKDERKKIGLELINKFGSKDKWSIQTADKAIEYLQRYKQS